MKRRLLALLVAVGLIFTAIIIKADLADAVAYSPTVNLTCSGTHPTWDNNACFDDASIFNGTGHVQRYYAPGTFSVVENINGHYLKVVYQGDGNLVIYAAGGVVEWASNTNGDYNAVMVLQMDGHIVIYHVDGTGHMDGTHYWASSKFYTSTQNWNFSFGAVWDGGVCFGSEMYYWAPPTDNWEDYNTLPATHLAC